MVYIFIVYKILLTKVGKNNEYSMKSIIFVV